MQWFQESLKGFSIIVSEFWDSRSHLAPLILDNHSAWQEFLGLGFYPLGFFWILCGGFHFLCVSLLFIAVSFNAVYLDWFCSNKAHLNEGFPTSEFHYEEK